MEKYTFFDLAGSSPCFNASLTHSYPFTKLPFRMTHTQNFVSQPFLDDHPHLPQRGSRRDVAMATLLSMSSSFHFPYEEGLPSAFHLGRTSFLLPGLQPRSFITRKSCCSMVISLEQPHPVPLGEALCIVPTQTHAGHLIAAP